MTSSIKENLYKINKQIHDAAISCGRKPEDIQLIAVSKRKSVAAIQDGIKSGARHFGENYIQEAVKKIDEIGIENVCWHFIGHLQSNKAKYAVKYFDYIHTVDTVKLANELNKQAEKIQKIQKIFVQVNIADEKTKSGTEAENTLDLVAKINDLKNVSLHGLMCMPPYFSEPEDARIYFRQLVKIKEQILKKKYHNVSMRHLSMGMSNDFKVAIEEGSTMVRVGTAIFGSRD